LDAGTHETLMQAANFIPAVEDRQGMKVGCPEEIAYRMGFIDTEQLLRLAEQLPHNGYRDYLIGLTGNEMVSSNF
jgi:glucose-1-phosphate thymidylyltransferase